MIRSMYEGGVNDKSQNKECYQRASVESSELWKNTIKSVFLEWFVVWKPERSPRCEWTDAELSWDTRTSRRL